MTTPLPKAVWRVFLVAFLLGAPALCAAERANVLVVYSQYRLLPANMQVDSGLIGPRDLLPSGPIQFFTEYLDHPYFIGEEYDAQTADYLASKYAGANRPKVIVAGGYVALGFLLRFRDRLFPGIPIIHMGVDKDYLESIPKLPADVDGASVDYDIGGTIDLAMKLHPKARRLLVVTGSTAWAADRLREIRWALERRKNVQVEYWSGLPTEKLLEQLRGLGPDTVVFSPGFYRDGAGQAFTPVDAVRLMASESGAPIYTIFSSHLGTGAVGGSMSTFADMGRLARTMLDEALSGRPLPAGAEPPTLPAVVQLDWRQVLKWDIPASLIPSDAIIHFRTPTLWEMYRTQIIIGGIVILAQSILIAALLVERRKRMRTANALLDSRRRVGNLSRAARVSIFDWSLDGQGNAPARPADPWTSGEIGRDFDEVLRSVHPSDRDRLSEAAWQAVKTGEELDVEYRTLDSQGQANWVEARGHAVRQGKPRIAGVCMDISDRKRAELQATQDRAALTHISRVATVGQFSAAIAHQLNQPLTAMLVNAEAGQKMVSQAHPPLDELKEVLDDIVAENGRVADIIRNLAALYRRGDAQRGDIDVNELVLETTELLRTELIGRHVFTRLELSSNLLPIEGTRIQLQQVLLNLVINAADAMADIPVGDRQLVIRTRPEGHCMELCVLDRGTGIAPDMFDRLFDPLWTTKGQGMGVGLPVSRAIVESHGGTIRASNNPEGGAAFCIQLPVSKTK